MEIEKKETEDEPQEEDKEEEENQEEKEDESEKTKEQEEVEETKPKTRRSFRLFKRKQTDKKAVKDEEKVVASEEPNGESEETQEEVEKENIAEEEDKKEIINDVEKEDTQDQEINEPETEKTQEQEEMLEQASELNTKPKLRRSFNLFRKRPVSMSAADRSGTDKDEEKFLSRDDPIRHSYHAGDLPVPDPSNLREYPLTIFWVWSSLQSIFLLFGWGL